MWIIYDHLVQLEIRGLFGHYLYNSLYKPYRKPNNKLIYINKQSNNLPNVLKQLPKSIAKIISDTTSSKDIFDKSISFYQNALCKSGFKEGLK